jgi:hypothetical protein
LHRVRNSQRPPFTLNLAKRIVKVLRHDILRAVLQRHDVAATIRMVKRVAIGICPTQQPSNSASVLDASTQVKPARICHQRIAVRIPLLDQQIGVIDKVRLVGLGPGAALPGVITFNPPSVQAIVNKIASPLGGHKNICQLIFRIVGKGPGAGGNSFRPGRATEEQRREQGDEDAWAASHAKLPSPVYNENLALPMEF